ncbi:hypothetical protein CDL12_09681 [Handroanthus impetiginosus]|uniref:APO domain-containing protein n=1 Tax=Handroanthus impetiginosus TaxID=429701 RepID=A0A2G9HJE2_9LAMI|nr:hypothetical protein CDL12_09681 [Handroanthus impetiginosus]
MNCGCLHTQFSSSTFLHSEGRNACLKSDLLKPSRQLSSCSTLSLQLNSRILPECSTHVRGLVIKCNYPQNADPPPYHSKKEKKPFPIPIVELRRAARERLKKSKTQPRGPVPPPKRGLVVQRLIHVAYRVLNVRIMCCSEIHVGPVGHPFKSCRGPQASIRRGVHEWGEAVLEDILVPVEAYHLHDRLGKRISHEERFSIPRISAVVELCIQAGKKKPIICIGKKEFIDADESELPDPDPEAPKPEILVEIPDSEIVPPSNEQEMALLAEGTLQAWEEMREGSKRLMKMYPVRVCGYCPEVHVDNGRHGWQAAILDDLIPLKYVWHVTDVNKPLERELRKFYGQVPAIVELCVQASAAVPEQYKPTMKLDVGIPTNVREAEMVV